MTNHDRSHYSEEPHDVSRPMPHHPVPYMKVFGALVVLTIITVLVGIALRFPAEIINVLIAIAIASAKAALVALFFMRFWRKTRDRLFVIFSIAFLLLAANWLLVGLSGAAEDRKVLFYVLRLLAFIAIIIGIVDKNRVRQ